jgi:hypothetical protein
MQQTDLITALIKPRDVAAIDIMGVHAMMEA